MFKVDEYGQVINCYESAMAVRKTIHKFRACAVPLALDGYTKLHITFVNLAQAVPNSTMHNGMYIIYEDGSARGCQINIDRFGSYALPWNKRINHMPSVCERINIDMGSGQYLEKFFNTVLTGENYFIN